MSSKFLAEVHRRATAEVAAVRAFDSGADAIEILFELAEPLPSGEANATGLLWLTEKGIENTRKTLKAVGVDPGDPAFETETDLCQAIVGKTFNLVCALEPANQYHKVDKWIVRFINAPKREGAGGSVLARLRGQQQILPLEPAPADDDVPF